MFLEFLPCRSVKEASNNWLRQGAHGCPVFSSCWRSGASWCLSSSSVNSITKVSCRTDFWLGARRSGRGRRSGMGKRRTRVAWGERRVKEENTSVLCVRGEKTKNLSVFRKSLFSPYLQIHHIMVSLASACEQSYWRDKHECSSTCSSPGFEVFVGQWLKALLSLWSRLRMSRSSSVRSSASSTLSTLSRCATRTLRCQDTQKTYKYTYEVKAEINAWHFKTITNQCSVTDTKSISYKQRNWSAKWIKLCVFVCAYPPQVPFTEAVV